MGRLYADPVATAYKIKDRIKEELGFTVNVGISTNKRAMERRAGAASWSSCFWVMPKWFTQFAFFEKDYEKQRAVDWG